MRVAVCNQTKLMQERVLVVYPTLVYIYGFPQSHTRQGSLVVSNLGHYDMYITFGYENGKYKGGREPSKGTVVSTTDIETHSSKTPVA